MRREVLEMIPSQVLMEFAVNRDAAARHRTMWR
jgi:hypothetical protein